MMNTMSKAARRAADSLAADVLAKTASGYGTDRPDVLDAVASALRTRASDLRQERIEREDRRR